MGLLMRLACLLFIYTYFSLLTYFHPLFFKSFFKKNLVLLLNFKKLGCFLFQSHTSSSFFKKIAFLI